MTTTLAVQNRFTRAYNILRQLHGDIAGMLTTMAGMSADLDDEQDFMDAKIEEASQFRPGLELLLDSSKLSRLDTLEEKTQLVLDALKAQPYWEAARIFAAAYGSNKTVTQADDGFVTTIAYAGGDDVHVQRIHTDQHPAMNVTAALIVAGL